MSKITWLVQNVGFSQTNSDQTELALQRMGFDYKLFGISRLINYVMNLENILIDPNEKFIIRGGTSLLTTLSKVHNLKEVNPNLSQYQLDNSEAFIKRLKAGLFYNEQKFDQNYYNTLNLPLLNNKANYYPVKNNLGLSFSKDMFIKPSRDQKAFNPGILEAGTTVESFIKSQHYEEFFLDEVLIVAPVKEIYSEYRFFVVDGSVITGSMYKMNGKLLIKEDVPPLILDCAKDYAKLYHPDKVFTMDLADTPEGIKIVEYNCWNASGLYATDAQKIFFAVHDFIEKN
jgi:hypothetical protein